MTFAGNNIYFGTINMDKTVVCPFDTLFTCNFPHILEKIFLSLDYETFKACCRVNNTWQALLTSQPFRKHFHMEILEDERKLMSATKEGNVEEVKDILSDGIVNVNCLTHSLSSVGIKSTPLCQAAKNGHEEVLQILLGGGAHPDGTDKYGRTPLYWAARKNCASAIHILIENGADARQQMEGPTPLHWAAHYGLKDAVKLLIDKGSQADLKDLQGHTPLQWTKRSPEKMDKDLVKLLLERGDEPGDWDLLKWAAENGYVDVAQLLIDKGAKFNKAGDFGLTPLHMAASNGHGDVVQILVDRGADLNKTELYGRTPLHYAVDPHRTDLWGKSKYQKTAEKRYKDIVKILIKGGADLNKTDLNENTVVKSAIEAGHKDLVQILLEAGAKSEDDRSAKDCVPRDKGKERRMTKYSGKMGHRQERRNKRYEKYEYSYEDEF